MCDYLADIVKRAGPFNDFEDPTLSASADEALDRMSRLRERFDSRGPHCGLIAYERANAPETLRFASGKAAHAIRSRFLITDHLSRRSMQCARVVSTGYFPTLAAAAMRLTSQRGQRFMWESRLVRGACSQSQGWGLMRGSWS